MALVNTIDRYEFKRTMERIDRDYFSFEAIDEIIAYFDEYPDNVEFDPIAICFEFTEATPEDIVNDYDNLDYIAQARDEDGDIDIDVLLDRLNYYTFAVRLNNGNILYTEF